MVLTYALSIILSIQADIANDMLRHVNTKIKLQIQMLINDKIFNLSSANNLLHKKKMDLEPRQTEVIGDV